MRLLVGLATAALLATACAGEPPPVTATTDDASPTDVATIADPGALTDYEAFELRITDAGKLTPELAIEGFGRAFGPVDGLTDQAADASITGSLTFAIDRMTDVAEDLTAEQQDAIDATLLEIADSITVRRTLAADADDFVDAPLPEARRARRSTPATSQLAAEEGDAEETRILELVEPVVRDARNDFDRLLDFRYDGDIDVAIATTSRLDGGALGASFDRTFAGVPFTTCALTFGRIVGTIDIQNLYGIVYHEIFHCYPRRMAPLGAANDRPAWVEEGAAGWVTMDASDGQGSLGRTWWRHYLQGDGYRPRTSFEYAGIGVFSHAFHLGSDPWETFQRVFTAPALGDDEAYFDLVIDGVSARFLDTWGPSRRLDTSWGEPWTSSGPGVRPPSSMRELLSFSDGAIPYTATRLFARPAPAPGELLVIRTADTTGAARWAPDAGGDIDLTGTDERSWCFPDDCTCSDGSTPPGYDPVPTPDGGVNLVIGVSAPSGGGLIEVVDVDLDDLCEECDEGAAAGIVLPARFDPRSPLGAAAPECPGDGGDVAGCPTGTWVVSPLAIAAQIEGLLAIEGQPSPSVAPAAGRIVATYRDGEVTVTYDNFTLVVAQTGVGGIPILLTFTGGGTGTYTIRDGNLITDPASSSINVAVTVGDTPIDGIGFDGSDFSGVIGTGRLECSDQLMTITVPIDGETGDLIYILTPTV